MRFNHELFIEAFSKMPFNPNWYYDDNIKVEIIEKLIEQKQFDIAAGLYWTPSREQKMALNETFGQVFDYGMPKYNLSSIKRESQKSFFDSILEAV